MALCRSLLRRHGVKDIRMRASLCAPFSTSTARANELPLAGVRVLELGQLIAGPFAGQLLGQFGAEIIKVEAPQKGDPLRVWRELDVDGCSPWFRSIGRNKRSVAIDLRTDEGRDLVRKLALRSDVLIENFKPGTLEKWSLDAASLHPHNPDLIYTRVSGYGQTGPWAARPGFASVCEAESGFRFINGFPDPETGGLSGPPVRPNISLGDSVAGLHAAFGTVLALLQRQKKREKGEAGGTTVDVSILESMLNLMEGIIPAYDRIGTVRGPSGSSVTGIVPTNAYPCLPAPSAPTTPVYIVIGANGDSLYARLMHLIGAPHLAGPRARAEPPARRAPGGDRGRDRGVDARAQRGGGGAAYGGGGGAGGARGEREGDRGGGAGAREGRGAGDGAADERGGGDGDGDGWHVKMPGTFPQLEGCDPKPRWAGPDLGAHTDEVLMGELGLSAEEMSRLRREGVIE
ncbi:L-carnitine dehydratase bile acid-inducible protein f [Mycena venus]|uniref:L-carnitine dehydratase bile acid-inducible protein f n=1 Tax=Mycena venus TaxID=2733690 RepID=A0A8H6XJX6_9AGAR|nr:L-carnitine dehydratase bile acid-inducible protein f [Mycena venus]